VYLYVYPGVIFRQDTSRVCRALGTFEWCKSAAPDETWSLHDIANTNIVWFMAYTRGVGGVSYIASIAIGRAMQLGGATNG